MNQQTTVKTTFPVAKVSFRVCIPQDATPEQIREWLRYELNDTGLMRGGNPLAGKAIEPIFGSFDFEIEE